MSLSEELVLCAIRKNKVMYMLNRHHMNYKYCKSLLESGFLRADFSTIAQ